MDQTKEQTMEDVEAVTTSEQNPETKDQSDSLSATEVAPEATDIVQDVISEGTWEEAPDEHPEATEKLVVGEGEVKEVPGDFVAAMNQPTEEQNPKTKVYPEHQDIVGQDFFTPQDDWKATVLGQFPTGEHLQVMKRPNGSMYYLAFREGLKKVPQEIQGNYTNYDKAEVAGRNYLNKLWEQHGAETASS